MSGIDLKPVFGRISVAVLVLLGPLCLLVEFGCAFQLELNPEGVPKSIRHILTNDLATFKAPLWMQKEYPYTLSGFDDYNRPIWIVDFGKWDVRRMVRNGGKDLQLFDTYLNQVVYTVLASRMRSNSTSDRNSTSSSAIKPNSNVHSKDAVRPNEIVLIFDFKTLSLSQLNSVRTVKYAVRKLRALKDGFLPVNRVHVINVNVVGEMLFNLVKPTLGKIFEKATVYKTNEKVWIPALLKHFSRDQIPFEYGGFKNSTPIIAFG